MKTECKDFLFSCPLPGSQGKRRIDIDGVFSRPSENGLSQI